MRRNTFSDSYKSEPEPRNQVTSSLFPQPAKVFTSISVTKPLQVPMRQIAHSFGLAIHCGRVMGKPDVIHPAWHLGAFFLRTLQDSDQIERKSRDFRSR